LEALHNIEPEVSTPAAGLRTRKRELERLLVENDLILATVQNISLSISLSNFRCVSDLALRVSDLVAATGRAAEASGLCRPRLALVETTRIPDLDLFAITRIKAASMRGED
jgi:hypothetical protein